MLWRYDYHCPHCKSQLTHNNEIRFVVETKQGKRGNLYLSAVPGVYGYESDFPLNIDHGDPVRFNCHACNTDLQSEAHPEFVEIHMKVQEGIEFEVFFSPIYGQQVTYVLMEDELVQYHENFFTIDQRKGA